VTSLALDVLEAVRPAVDRFVLHLLTREVFRADDFVETRAGSCRIVPTVTHRLVESFRLWREAVAPVVERVATLFAETPGSRVAAIPTRLTESRRSASRAAPARPSKGQQTQRAFARCITCGVDVSAMKRWCDKCRPAVLGAQSVAPLAPAHARRMELRAAGSDPATSTEAKAKQAAERRRRIEEQRAWQSANVSARDPSDFARDILPALANVPLRKLARATGLSLPYLSEVRAGKKTPHERWWDALQDAVPRLE